MTTRHPTKSNFFNFTHATGNEITQIIFSTFQLSMEILDGCITLIFIFIFLSIELDYLKKNQFCKRIFLEWLTTLRTTVGLYRPAESLPSASVTKRSLTFDCLRLNVLVSSHSLKWLAFNLFDRATDFSLVKTTRSSVSYDHFFNKSTMQPFSF